MHMGLVIWARTGLTARGYLLNAVCLHATPSSFAPLAVRICSVCGLYTTAYHHHHHFHLHHPSLSSSSPSSDLRSSSRYLKQLIWPTVESAESEVTWVLLPTLELRTASGLPETVIGFRALPTRGGLEMASSRVGIAPSTGTIIGFRAVPTEIALALGTAPRFSIRLRQRGQWLNSEQYPQRRAHSHSNGIIARRHRAFSRAINSFRAVPTGFALALGRAAPRFGIASSAGTISVFRAVPTEEGSLALGTASSRVGIAPFVSEQCTQEAHSHSERQHASSSHRRQQAQSSTSEQNPQKRAHSLPERHHRASASRLGTIAQVTLVLGAAAPRVSIGSSAGTISVFRAVHAEGSLTLVIGHIHHWERERERERERQTKRERETERERWGEKKRKRERECACEGDRQWE